MKTSNNTLIDGTNVDENTKTKCDQQLGRRKRDAVCSGDKENDSEYVYLSKSIGSEILNR